MEDSGAEKLAEALKMNSSLQTIILRGNDIFEQGGIKIAMSLKDNSSLQSIDLSGNEIVDGAIRVFGEHHSCNLEN